MKNLFKQKITTTDTLFILVNLVPLVGVWFYNWDPTEIFIIYCFETLIVGIMTVVKLFITTLFKKKDELENGGSTSQVSGYFFIFFFIIHFGFFVFVQMTIFLSIISIEGLKGGPSAFFKLISNPTQYIGNVGILLILMFFVTYGFAVIKDFILPQKYKTVSMAETMFSPYGRIFVQQFVVIIGSFILLFNASKIFILIFVITKIFFELLVRFDKLKMLSKKN